MGQIFSFERCDQTCAAAFTFSEDLVLKLADGIDSQSEKIETGQSPDAADRERGGKITSNDKSHSVSYGLDEDSFNHLLCQMDKKLQDEQDASILTSGKRETIKCYVKNRKIELCYEEVIKKYNDCVDLYRPEKMKRHKTDSHSNSRE